jgi:hypothetical protein
MADSGQNMRMTAINVADKDLAGQVIRHYQDLPGLRVGLISGSVARGIADKSSDLDLYPYWDHANRDSLCLVNRLQPLGTDRLVSLVTPTGVFEKHRLGQRMIDVESVDVATINNVVNWLGGDQAMTSLIEKTVSGLIDGVAIVGQDELEEWKQRIRYTDALARAQVVAHVGGLLPPVILYSLTLARGDAVSFFARTSDVLLHSVALVAAANRSFIAISEPKWLHWQLGRMPHVPPKMTERMNAGLLHPSLEAMGDLDLLLHEVLDLVETHVPEADTSVGRFILAMG